MSYDVIASQPIVIDNVSYRPRAKAGEVDPSGRYLESQGCCGLSVIFPFHPLLQGSGIIKAGFAGDDYPKVHFPSL